jgi:LacI family transcriptional regulator
MPSKRSRRSAASAPSVTLRDVARAAGVHTATVSRALNEQTRGLINDETARRVIAEAARLGYRPNSIARGLKTNRSYTVGVVVPDLRNPLFPPILRGIEERLEPSGYTSLLANTDNDPERERLGFDALRARQVDGYITATAQREHPLLHEVAAAGRPLVLVNRVADTVDLPSVTADDRGGMRMAVEHVHELGHERIAYVGGSPALSTGAGRRDGFVRAMSELGLAIDDDRVAVGVAYAEEEGARLTRDLLSRGETPTAIVAGNDLMALGCIDALREAGLDVPGDVSVVGFNDMDFSERFCPPLTTIRVPHHELGVQAAELLLERLASPASETRHVVLPVELVVRGSTAPAAVGRPRR